MSTPDQPCAGVDDGFDAATAAVAEPAGSMAIGGLELK